MTRRLFLLLILLSTAVMAESGKEIVYLLNYVKETSCTYIRNGTEHNGVEASAHIEKKYDYFREKIATAEDFIRLCATQSTMSGRKYRVRCPGGTEMESGKWLLEALRRYRSGKLP